MRFISSKNEIKDIPFPDPVDGDILDARAFVQKHSIDVILAKLFRQTIKTKQHAWLCYLTPQNAFPLPMSRNLTAAKQLFQNMFSKYCAVCKLTILENESDTYWCLQLKEFSKAIPSISYIYTKVFENSRLDKSDTQDDTPSKDVEYSRAITKTKKAKIKEKSLAHIEVKSCSVEVYRNKTTIVVPISEVQETDFPKKLLYKNINITRLVLKTSRITKTSWNTLKEYLNKYLSSVKYYLSRKHQPFVPAQDTPKNKQDEDKILPHLPPRGDNINQHLISYDYANLNRLYMKSKLNDRQTLNYALRHIFLKSAAEQSKQSGNYSQLMDDLAFVKVQLSLSGILDTDIKLLVKEFLTDKGLISDYNRLVRNAGKLVIDGN